MGVNGNLGPLLVAVAAGFAVRLVRSRKLSPLLHHQREEEEEEEEEEGLHFLPQENNGEPERPLSSSTRIRPVQLKWENLSCVFSDKSGKNVRWILKNVGGCAKPGRLLAIMGPSGSGKTTLLNVLAGQLSASPRLHLTGYLYINGRPFLTPSYKLAYVRQEDLFFSQLTVRETLSLAAALQFSNSMSEEERTRYVDDLIFRLGLASCVDTRVGDAKVRGISGGEKKRLSIACELMASPSVIFADEPTTGLDAFQAERVMETLRGLAHEGHTVVCSIHQPRGSIYAKFDDLILLAEGSVVYTGPAQEHALSYFRELGHNCPEHVNPAEYFADLISIDCSSSDSENFTHNRVKSLVDAFTKQYSKNVSMQENVGNIAVSMNGKGVHAISSQKKGRGSKKGGWWRQFALLLKRAWMQSTRDGPTNKVRANMSIASALIFGSIFWRMGLLQTSIQDRMGLLQVAAINTAMAALTKTVNVFPKERQIVNRERAKGSYTLGPYLLAKLIAEIPIGAAFPLMFGTVLYPMARLHPTLQRFVKFSGIITVESFTATAMGLTVGAMAPTVEAAMALGPSLMTVFIVFGGYYVNPENTLPVFRWIPRVSLIRWAFQALCINEFKGLKFEHPHSYDLQTGEQVLDRLSFGKSTIGEALIWEARILLFWYLATYALLKKNKPKYQRLHPCASRNHNTSVKIEEIKDAEDTSMA